MKHKNIGSNFDDFLAEEELLADTESVAIKRVMAFQIDQYMKEKNISITLNLNNGQSGFVGWTTDLSHDYIDINAEYN